MMKQKKARDESKRREKEEEMKAYMELQTKKLEMEETIKRRKLEIEEAVQMKKLEIEATNANTKAKRGGASFHDRGLEQDIPGKKKLVREEAKSDARSR